MLVENSDSHGSGHTGAAGKNKSKKPPFKLCFPRHQMSGRSDVRAPKIHKVEIKGNYDVAATVEASMRKDNEKPRDIRRWPLLSSESYGWWYDRSFGIRDQRFNHHKNTSELVRSNVVIQWQDKKLQGLCH